MESKYKTILIIISISTLILLGLFISGGIKVMAIESENLSAIAKSYTYDSELTEIIFSNESKDTAKIKLLTPVNNQVPRGYQKVAEYEINSLETLEIFVSEIEYYDLKDSMKSLKKTIDFKVKRIGYENVSDYDRDCVETETFHFNCTPEILVGSHFEERVYWDTLGKVEFLKDETITIGLFTDVQVGDSIEWIPTFSINDIEYRIIEWAVWTEAMKADLVSYWKLDDSSGDAIDDGPGQQNNGTNYAVTQSATGKIETAYNYYDASNSLTNVTTDDGLQPTSVTVNAWLNTDFSSPGYIVSHRAEDVDEGRVSYSILTDGTNALYGISYKSGGDTGAAITGDILQNTWVMATFIANTTGNYLYLNGTASVNTTTSGNIRYSTENTKTYFGARHREGNAKDFYYNGTADEIGIWNRSLTPSEISDLWDGGAGLPYSDGIDVLNITDPTTASPVTVTNSSNTTIQFNFTRDNVPVTSGVTMEDVWIDNSSCTILQGDSSCGGTADICSSHSTEATCDYDAGCSWAAGSGKTVILTEGFESGWVQIVNNAAPVGDCSQIGNFNTCDNNGGDYEFASSSDSSPDISHTGTYGLVAEDWDSGAETATDGIWYSFDASTSCSGGVCTYIEVDFWFWELGMDNGEACWVTEQDVEATGTPADLGPSLIQPINSYTNFKANLSAGMLTSNNVSVRIMCDMNNGADDAFFDDFNISGYESDACSGTPDPCSTYDASQTNCERVNCDFTPAGDELWYENDFWNVNVTVPDKVDGTYNLYVNATYSGTTAAETETSSVIYGAGDSCTCTDGASWTIIDGDQCVLSTTCNLGANPFRVMDGKLTIDSTGSLNAQGCYIQGEENLFVFDGGKLTCRL